MNNLATPDRIPTLFVSHGSPMFAVEPGETGPALQRWGKALQEKYPAIKGVVILSPHWMSQDLEVMSSHRPETWHDFGGFPQVLYTLQYPAPGAPLLAQQVHKMLLGAGLDAKLNPRRPRDHGAWVPMMHLLPEAELPVIQLSLPAHADAAHVYALGKALQPLRDAGILLVGSGSMTHNLREFFTGVHAGSEYVQSFSRWIEERIQAGETDQLLRWRELAPEALRAHPTDEHFLPLFFTLGAGGDHARVEYLSREVMQELLAMDSFALH